MDGPNPCLTSLIRAFTIYHVMSCLSAVKPVSGSNQGKSRQWNSGFHSQSSLRYLRAAADHPGLSSNLDMTTKEAMDILDLVEHLPSRTGACSKPTTLPLQKKDLPGANSDNIAAHEAAAVKTANVINNLLRFRGANLLDEYFYSLARATVEGDLLIEGSVIAFDSNQYNSGNFGAAIYRQESGLVAFDLAQTSNDQYLQNGTEGYEWFWGVKRDYSKELKGHTCQTSNPYEGMQASTLTLTADTALSTQALGHWTKPYYDCGSSNMWLITYSIPFFGCKSRQGSNELTFKGVVAVSVDLHKLDIDQCATDGSFFSNTHKCRPNTMCHHVPSMGFQRGSYVCKCKDGFHHKSPTTGVPPYFNGSYLERQGQGGQLNQINSSQDDELCLPCQEICPTSMCTCFVEYDVMRRIVPLGIQSFCMTIAVVLGLVILSLRKSKVMKASMWCMLEILLMGALLLYSTVLIQYFEPSTATCLLVPWFREVGFAVVYGALILKIYRVLAEFQSRRANRVHVRDQDLLKYLLGGVLVVVGYMSAWTAVNMDHVREGDDMLAVGTTSDKLKYYICKAVWWDYVIEMGEFLFLCFGIYLCYCVRQAPSDYGEIRYISMAIYLETVFSGLLHILRHFIWLVIHPDYIFLMYFIRCQLTVTIALIVVLGPKLWYAHRPPEDEHFRNRTYSSSDVHDTILPESMKLHVGISSNGDVDVGEINLAEMDPEDIRAELKRLYTQLQVYKTKTMRKDNPHISKRRGGRKQTHRRFSLQAFHYKHRHHHAPSEHDHDHELSKTPEESTNSAEGVTIQMDPSSSRGDEEACRTPTVTFKPGHKSFS